MPGSAGGLRVIAADGLAHAHRAGPPFKGEHDRDQDEEEEQTTAAPAIAVRTR